jgi:signal transduction histidine kinase/CheY-like chemotaxis protein
MSERDEMERLRAENEALNEQLKVLVRTEQRLFRSRKALDEELANTRALAGLALLASPTDTTDDVVHRVLALLGANFHVDCALALTRSAGDPDCVACDGQERRATVRLSAPLLAWLHANTTREVTALGELDPGALDGLMDVAEALGLPRDPDRSANLAALRVRCAESQQAIGLFVWKSQELRRSVVSKAIEPHHEPFLQALASQLSRTLDAVTLTQALAMRGSELTEANLRLSESLASLTETQEKLVQAQKMEAIGRLAGGVAHDFNNLLTVILGHAELVLDQGLADGGSTEDATAILDAAMRATTITRQLLSFSRQQSQRPQELELNEFVANTTRVLGRLIGEHIRIELALAPTSLPLRFDAGQLEQVLMNLTLNARDAMAGGGTLSIRTRRVSADEAERAGVERRDDFIGLEIADSGVGIPDELLTHVFEPFFTTKEVGRGTGLGLATVHGVVEQSGGHVFVESEVGRGTTFTIFFRSLTIPSLAPSPATAAPRTTPARGTVLVAEDEPAIRKLVCRALLAEGYAVYDAGDGEAALELAATAAFDLLITDMVMPKMTGALLAEKVRQLHPSIRVLFVSGYPLRGNAPGPAQWDARAVLAKPFSAAALLTAVHAAFA